MPPPPHTPFPSPPPVSSLSLEDEAATNARSTTGVLTSHPQSRDVHFESFSLLYYGHELLQDTDVRGRGGAGNDVALAQAPFPPPPPTHPHPPSHTHPHPHQPCLRSSS